MVKLLSRHPDGAAGVALALMRLSCALLAFPVLTRSPLVAFLSSLAAIISGIIALALLTGIGTRVLALMLACVATVDVFTVRSGLKLTLVADASAYAALIMLGPGAYSIDALAFGRRVVRLDPRSPDRGTDD